jgi:hypothetical protein
MILLTPIQVSALNIANPQIVSNMKVGILENGTIEINGDIRNLELNLSIPQDDSYQTIESFNVNDSNGPCKTDFCSYKFVFDKFGNKLLNIRWKKPTQNIMFWIDSTVSVNKRTTLDKKMLNDFIMPTNLVQSADPEIVGLASQARGNDFEKLAYLAKWVGENIEYDRVYSDVSLSAKDILSVRKGVCKEFSNLLVSFLRDLGYYSAVAVGYVYPGRVYETDKFQPHGWTEVYADEGIVADPTWAEVGYLDATHIKFAVFPDSRWTFSSVNADGVGQIKINLKDVNVDIKLLDFSEEPIVNTKTDFLEKDVWSKYAVLRTDLTTKGCILTKVEIKSCTDESGKDFLRLINPENIVYFCDKKSIFSIFEIPNLDPKGNYRCTISLLPYAGEQNSVQLLMSFKEEGNAKISVEKTVLEPGERFSVVATNSHIFTDFGGYGFGNAEFVAPYYDFKVYAYNSGSLNQQDVSVTLQKPIDVSLHLNKTVFLGKSVLVDVKVTNLINKPEIVTVRFIDSFISEEIIGSKNFIFDFTPQNIDDNIVQVFVNTSDFTTSVSETLYVIKQKGLLDNIIQPIIDFFNWLVSLFKR